MQPKLVTLRFSARLSLSEREQSKVKSEKIENGVRCITQTH
ncbi:hypothetical protein M595_5131 [Lyngbya aestuarii BL J]|uniref:Uncharacterized protein n=1 Tax=Lyngbya aestuarii BL J TaxID=1348334 RepID=U7QD75_9CYAN|nr:hypothetical protein M595_5131 [Lyngbya aestuarii BL J]